MGKLVGETTLNAFELFFYDEYAGAERHWNTACSTV